MHGRNEHSALDHTPLLLFNLSSNGQSPSCYEPEHFLRNAGLASLFRRMARLHGFFHIQVFVYGYFENTSTFFDESQIRSPAPDASPTLADSAVLCSFCFSLMQTSVQDSSFRSVEHLFNLQKREELYESCSSLAHHLSMCYGLRCNTKVSSAWSTAACLVVHAAVKTAPGKS